MVRNATRWPGSGRTGTGSRASSVARHSVATLRNANQPMIPVVTVIDDRGDVHRPCRRPVRPVARQHQPGEEAADEQQRGEHQQRAAHGTRTVEPPEPHAVRPPRGRLRQRSSQLAVALVVVGSVQAWSGSPVAGQGEPTRCYAGSAWGARDRDVAPSCTPRRGEFRRRRMKTAHHFGTTVLRRRQAIRANWSGGLDSRSTAIGARGSAGAVYPRPDVGGTCKSPQGGFGGRAGTRSRGPAGLLVRRAATRPRGSPRSAGDRAQAARTRSPGRRLYVDPQSPAALQAARWRSEGRKRDAAAMHAAGEAPDRGLVRRRRRRRLARARGDPERGQSAAAPPCWSPTTCPAATAAATRPADRAPPRPTAPGCAAFARGIGTRRAIVILEPDAIPQAVVESCLSAPAQGRALRAAAPTACKTLGARSRTSPSTSTPATRAGSARRPASSARCAPPASAPPTASPST